MPGHSSDLDRTLENWSPPAAVTQLAPATVPYCCWALPGRRSGPIGIDREYLRFTSEGLRLTLPNLKTD